jgi:hypothetical protein
MDAVHLVFIYIRFKPEDPIQKNIIYIFQKHLKEDMKFAEIKKIASEVETLESCDYKLSLLYELRKFNYKRNKFILYGSNSCQYTSHKIHI